MYKLWWQQYWPILMLGLLVGLAGAEMIWLTIARYRGFNALGFDLGVMSQAIWSVTQGKLLLFSQEGIVFSRLARHVELIYFPVAFFYAIWPSPETLLVIQALLYASGGIPVYRLAQRHLQAPRPTLVMVVIYLLYPVAQTSVLFDFHGDTLAMPFLLFLLDAADRKAWRSYAIWLVLALSCKMYVAIAVALLGGVLWLKGERKVGVVTFSAAALWGAIAFFVIRALFAPPEAEAVSATATSYFNQYFGQLDLANTGFDRLFNAFVVLFPVLPLALYAPLWFLPGLALAGAVLISSSAGPSYAYYFHHYALAVPFFIMAIIMGAGERRRQQKEPPSTPNHRRSFAWRLQLLMVLQFTILFNSAFVNTPLNVRFYTQHQLRGRLPARYGITLRDEFLATWLNENIPLTAPVMTDIYLATHLTNRSILYLSDYEDSVRSFDQLLPEVDYVLYDLFTDPLWPEHFDWWQGQFSQITADGHLSLARAEDGLLLFARQEEGLPYGLTIATEGTISPVIATFYDQIGLIDVAIEPLGNHRYELTYTWIVQPVSPDAPPLVAMTLVAGWDRGRIPHPASLTTPPSTWPIGVPIQETLILELPPNLPSSSYTLAVNWYNYDDLLRLIEAQPMPDHLPISTTTLEIP